jgi:hypothetical protein
MFRIIFVSIAIMSNLCVASELLEKSGFYPKSMSEVKVPEQSEEVVEEQQAKFRQRSTRQQALSVATAIPTTEPSRVLTISFLDQAPSLKYEPLQNGRWDQQWHHDIQVSQRNYTVLEGLDTLIDGNNQEVQNLWQKTWKNFNFLQKSILLESIDLF